MVSEICKAKDPRTCPYHGAVMRMYDAQSSGDLEAYFTARITVEELQKKNWDENTPLPDANTLLTGSPAVGQPRFARQTLLGGQKIYAHTAGTCAGANCSIHNPSNHALKDAPMNWRKDISVMERICDHGVGHPDPDDVNFRIKNGANPATASTHGCDGCCQQTAPAAVATPAANYVTQNLVDTTNIPTTDDIGVNQGGIYDQVAVVDQDQSIHFNGQAVTVFTRLTDGISAVTPNAIRIQANRRLTPEDTKKFAALVDYEYQVAVDRNGINVNKIYQDTPFSFVIPTKPRTRNDDSLPDAFTKFAEELPDMVKEGSPRRKTNRSGFGTRGTRLAEGFNEDNLKFEIYLDSTEED